MSPAPCSFASRCRRAPNHPRDATRLPVLQYGRGLGTDEAAAFRRGVKAGLVIVHDDRHFLVPTARACSTNLHLIGRNEDHVALHTEVLIHIGAYAELVDCGWQPSQLVFDPFIRGAALDLWGYGDEPMDNQNWWEGHIVFVAAAKARVTAPDSLTALLNAFERLQADSTAGVDSGHRRKWEELVRIVTDHGAVELLLVANGARWWYQAEPGRGGVVLRPPRI